GLHERSPRAHGEAAERLLDLEPAALERGLERSELRGGASGHGEAQRSPSASRTWSAWPSTRTFGKTLRTTPSPSMTTLEPIIPVTFLPYITFPPQAPYFLATALSGSASSG